VPKQFPVLKHFLGVSPVPVPDGTRGRGEETVILIEVMRTLAGGRMSFEPFQGVRIISLHKVTKFHCFCAYCADMTKDQAPKLRSTSDGARKLTANLKTLYILRHPRLEAEPPRAD
jgi:hypothetical protein